MSTIYLVSQDTGTKFQVIQFIKDATGQITHLKLKGSIAEFVEPLDENILFEKNNYRFVKEGK